MISLVVTVGGTSEESLVGAFVLDLLFELLLFLDAVSGIVIYTKLADDCDHQNEQETGKCSKGAATGFECNHSAPILVIW